MPAINTPLISSQKKILPPSSPKQRGATYKSAEIVKDSDDEEGDVPPLRNGKQEPESKHKPENPSIGSLTAKTSAAISNGAPTRKRKRDTPSAAVADSSYSLSNSQIHKEAAENIKSAQAETSSGSESESGNENSPEGSDNELSKTKEVTTKK